MGSMLLYNGTIYTMEKSSQVIELQGRVAFPGFIDPHIHLFNMAESEHPTLDEAQQLAIEKRIDEALITTQGTGRRLERYFCE